MRCRPSAGAAGLLGFLLVSCAGGAVTEGVPGSEPAPAAAEAAAAVTEPAPARPVRSARPGPAIRGPQPHRDDPPEVAEPDPLTQARADCWMKVESQKAKLNIDQRAAFVDRCVSNATKGKGQ
jgi:hypothetical protein